MVFITPTNTSVLEFKGLHLYHTNRSNCSARVRLLMEEKELPWTSHHIDLGKKENISEEYFGINPKGVVPALVDDGTVVTESNDIMLYLEDKYPDPGFRDVPAGRQAEIDRWLKLSGDMHLPAIKTYQYYKINAALLPKTDEEQALYDKLQTDPELTAFHAKHSHGRSFTEEDANTAIGLLNRTFAEIEDAIADGGWMVGDAYTLADISWSPTYTTLLAGSFDFGPYPNVRDWYERILQRPQFEKAVIEWRKTATYAAGSDPTIPGDAKTA